MPIAVFVPSGLDVPDLPSAAVHRFDSPGDLAAQLARTPGIAVLVSDGLEGEAAASIADAVRSHEGQVIEVQFNSWDGISHSPLSAVCRGVVAGFGPAGVAAAIAALSEP